MDETVVGAAPARWTTAGWTTAGMKREDGMQGSRSEAVDERGRSLVMDGGVGYQLRHGGGGRRWMGWRTEEAAVERVFWCPRSKNGEMEGERKGEICLQGALVSNVRKFTKLAPVSNFLHHSNISRLGIRQ